MWLETNQVLPVPLLPPPCSHHLTSSLGINHLLTGNSLLPPSVVLPVSLLFTLHQGFFPTCRLGHTLHCQSLKLFNGFSLYKDSTPLLGIQGHLTIFCPTTRPFPSPTSSAQYSNLPSGWVIHPTWESPYLPAFAYVPECPAFLIGHTSESYSSSQIQLKFYFPHEVFLDPPYLELSRVISSPCNSFSSRHSTSLSVGKLSYYTQFTKIIFYCLLLERLS